MLTLQAAFLKKSNDGNGRCGCGGRCRPIPLRSWALNARCCQKFLAGLGRISWTLIQFGRTPRNGGPVPKTSYAVCARSSRFERTAPRTPPRELASTLMGSSSTVGMMVIRCVKRHVQSSMAFRHQSLPSSQHRIFVRVLLSSWPRLRPFQRSPLEPLK